MKLSSAAANLIAPHPLHEDPEFCFDWVEHRPFAEAAYRGDKRLHRLLPKLVPRRFVTLHSHHRLNASSSDDCCCSIHTIAVLFYRVCVCLADRPEALVCASFLCLLLTCSRVRPRLSASPQHIRGGLLAQLLLACLCRQAPLRARAARRAATDGGHPRRAQSCRPVDIPAHGHAGNARWLAGAQLAGRTHGAYRFLPGKVPTRAQVRR